VIITTTEPTPKALDRLSESPCAESQPASRAPSVAPEKAPDRTPTRVMPI